MTASLSFRLARATVFAVVCVGLSVAAHHVGGGSVSAPVLAGGLLLTFCAALAASGRERPPLVVLPLLGGLQAALHVLFSLSHAPAAQMAGGQMAGVHMAGGHLLTGHAVAGYIAGGPGQMGLVPSGGMLVAHCWAAVLVGLWLARGEAALWGVVRRMAVRLCRVVLVQLQPFDEPVVVVAAPEPGRLRSAVLAHAAPRRGPPFTHVIAA